VADLLGVIGTDSNQNGILDAEEERLSGITVYLDQNNNGSLNEAEPTALTNVNGEYEFRDLNTGIYQVRVVPSADPNLEIPFPDSDRIPFTGLEAKDQGVAGWQADGTGSEPSRIGHAIPNSLGLDTQNAFYYLASVDFDNINPDSPGAIQGTGNITGFPQLADALSTNGFTTEDLTLKFDLLSLGDDVEGEDWFVNGDVETRFYTRFNNEGAITLQLAGEDLISGLIPEYTLQIDYNDPTFTDDRTSGWIEGFIPSNVSGSSSAEVQAVAAALLADVGDKGLRFLFDALQPSSQLEFIEDGRTGAFFEAQVGQIELSEEFSVREGSYTVVLDSDETVVDLNFVALEDEAAESLDIDGNGEATITDGRLLFNYLSVAGSSVLNPEPLVENIVQGALDLDAEGATRTSGEEIVNFLEDNLSEFDIDGNGNTTVTDGRLLFNYLSVAGSSVLNPEPLVENIVQGALELDAAGATRTTGAEIVDFIEGLI